MWRLRHAVRGIFLNSKGEIPIIYATKDGYYKLPWWGIEVDEDMLVALEREMMEEVGAVVSHLSALGIVIEFKSQSANLQISTVFTGRISHLSSPPHYTEQELLDGLTLLWCTPSQALELMISAKPTSYIGKCIRLRDIRILEFYSILTCI